MKPLVALSAVTRMLTPYCVQFWSPYEVVPTTTCDDCAAPAGKSAGPPLSPLQGPAIFLVPPSVYWKYCVVTF